MSDASFGELLLRTVVSLAVVFGLIAAAYQVMRRRGGGSGQHLLRLDRPRRSSVPSSRRGIKVLSRVGINRTAQLVAVQVGDEVLLVAAGEHGAPSVVKTMSAAAWEAATEPREERIPLTGSGATVAVSAGGPAVAARPQPRGFLDAVREATVRRA